MEQYDQETIQLNFARKKEPNEFQQENIKNIIFPKRPESESPPVPEIPKKVSQ